MVHNVMAMLVFDELTLFDKLRMQPPKGDLVYLVRNGCNAPLESKTQKVVYSIDFESPKAADEIY